MNNDSISGYKKLENTKGITTDWLFEELKKVTLSFGTPTMGEMLKKPAVTWKIGNYTVYVQADESKIQMGGVISENIGKNLLKQVGIGLLTGNFAGSKDNAESDRAVEELYKVVVQLVGGQPVENVASNVSTGIEKSFYMEQKVFSLTAKYNIYLEDKTPVYFIQSDLTHLNYSISREGTEIFKLKKKLIALLPEFSIFEDGSEIGHLKKKLKLTKPEIVGEIKGKNVCLKGDVFGNNYEIEFDGKVVATVDTAVLTWGDCYRIKVREDSLQDYVMIFAVIIDNVIDAENS
ncbi:MAG: hypothetical protein K6G09_01765 [Treponema sp.]|nr:hypothetical protein [Treponema sp.]